MPSGQTYGQCVVGVVAVSIGLLAASASTPAQTQPSVIIDDVVVTEGSSGTKTAVFTVSLSGTSSSTVTVIATTEDNVARAGSDYNARSATISFPAGSISQTFTVGVNGDATVEMAESFFVILSSASNGDISDGSGRATIFNDDFTDQSLAGATVKAIHVEELRAAVDLVRIEAGLSAFGFTDPTLTAQQMVMKAAHVTELRSALGQLRAAAGAPPLVFAESTISPGVTTVKVSHLTEIRAALASLPSIASPRRTATVTFGGLPPDSSPFVTYVESGFTIESVSHNWTANEYGHPSPSIVFGSSVNTSRSAEIRITAEGAPFSFRAVDLYSSVTPIPYVITGMRESVAVFTVARTEGNTFGRFATVEHPSMLVDTLYIRLTSPATACCGNRMGLDTIVLSR